MITIIDYGMGNLGSIQSMLKKGGHKSVIGSTASDINSASKIILPGVGAFDKAMSNIEQMGIKEALNHSVIVGNKPILGICLGMQLLAKRSEEGTKEGLGWIDAQIKRFPKGKDLKVPHMGWNVVTPARPHLLFSGMPAEQLRFYFVHSFYMENNMKGDIAALTKYGVDFTCAVIRNNIHGVQFHPEKSHKFGLQLLNNFANA